MSRLQTYFTRALQANDPRFADILRRIDPTLEEEREEPKPKRKARKARKARKK